MECKDIIPTNSGYIYEYIVTSFEWKSSIQNYFCDFWLKFFLKVGLSEPHRIGQAKKVQIKLRGSAPMQIDGEPWEQHPAEILITHHKSTPILKI